MNNDRQNATSDESDAAAADPGMTFVGRDKELAEIDAVLQRRAPGVIVVRAEAGMGKTTLLRAVAWRAANNGWSTTSADGEGEIDVSQATTEEEFCSSVRTRLGISAEETVVETDPSTGRLHPLVRQLRPLAPVLLLIDGFRPNARFGTWFRTLFLRQIAGTGAAIVVIVADRPGDVETLASVAKRVLSLEPPDAEAVREHFESIGRQLTPPMKPDELEQYVQAAQEKPEILDTLTRLLRLVQKTEP